VYDGRRIERSVRVLGLLIDTRPTAASEQRSKRDEVHATGRSPELGSHPAPIATRGDLCRARKLLAIEAQI
jgi:hypothetical protein